MFTAKTDKKTALFLADGCEEIEALTVADLLYRAGIPCTRVSVNANTVVTSSHNCVIIADTTADQLDWDSYDMLILPGGMPGTTHLGECKLLTDHILSFEKEGKQIAAICAAPSVLAKLGILNGRKATSNPSVKKVLVENGAEYSEDPVVVAGNIYTSRAMGTAIPFGLEIVGHYLGKETADALGRNILYEPGTAAE